MTAQYMNDSSLRDDEQLVEAVAHLTFMISATIADVAGSHDLSVTQLRLLGILRDHEPRMSELARHLGLDRSSVSGLIDRARSRGLVRRFPDSYDRRATRISLTDHGRAIAELFAAETTAQIRPLFAQLAVRDRVRLTTLLQRVLPPAPGNIAS